MMEVQNCTSGFKRTLPFVISGCNSAASEVQTFANDVTLAVYDRRDCREHATFPLPRFAISPIAIYLFHSSGAQTVALSLESSIPPQVAPDVVLRKYLRKAVWRADHRL